MIRAVLVFLGIVLPVAAAAYVGGGAGSTANNTVIFENPSCNSNHGLVTANKSGNGYTPVTTALTPSQTTLVNLVVGDSISSNSNPTSFVTTNPSFNHQFNIWDATTYQYIDQALGAGTGTPSTGGPGGTGSYPGYTADFLINAAKFQRVITANVSQGGACTLDFAAGGQLLNKALVACRMMKLVGIPTQNTGNWKSAITYALGVNDAILNDQAVLVQTGAQIQANIQSFIDSMRGIGCNQDIFIAKTTCNSVLSNYNVKASYQAAQAAVLSPVNANVFAGANRDALCNATYTNTPPDVHLNSTGQGSYGADTTPGTGVGWGAVINARY